MAIKAGGAKIIKNYTELKNAVSARGARWGVSGTWINRFRKLRSLQTTAQQFFDMNYQITVYKKSEAIKLPTARQMVATFLSHMPLTNPIVKVTPFKATAPNEKRAEKQQAYFQALLLHELQQSEPPLIDAARDIGIRGEAFLKAIYDVGVTNNLPKKLKDESEASYKDRKLEYLIENNPILVTCPDPMTCYPSVDHLNCRPLEMIEVYTVYAGEIRRIWGKDEWESTKKDNELVVFIEYHNDDKRCFLADGKFVTNKFEPNPYNRVPYLHVYSGWGHRTKDNKPEDRAISMIFEAENAIKEQSRFRSYLDKSLAFASNPVVRTSKAQSEFPESGLVVTPGMVLYGEETLDVLWAASSLPAGIMQAIMLSEQEINKGQASVLRGDMPRGVEAGYAAALMIGEARLKFGIPLENLKALCARTLELVRHLIRTSDEELALWSKGKALTLSPQDCEGAFRIEVDFESTSKQQQIQEAVGVQRLRQGGSISLQTELELNPLIPDARKERIRIEVESLSKHPAIQRIKAIKAIRAKEGEEAAKAVAEAMEEGEAGAERKALSSGIPPGGGGESELPEDVLASAISRRGRAKQGAGETEVSV